MKKDYLDVLTKGRSTKRNGKFALVGLCVLLLAGSGLLGSCKNVRLATACFNSPRKFENAITKHPELTPLTAAELKDMLQSDTSHYKVVNIYSPCCGPCIQHLRTTFRQYTKTVDTTDVRFYYIAEDCSGLKYVKTDMNSWGYYLPKYYYLRDTSAAFVEGCNDNRLNNIAHYLFPDQPKTDGLLGIPVNFIVDKQGRVKQYYEIDTAGRQELVTTPLWAIGNTRICELDFNTIDTLYHTDEGLRYCTTKWCRMWKFGE